jgi:hypothetical protein
MLNAEIRIADAPETGKLVRSVCISERIDPSEVFGHPVPTGERLAHHLKQTT